VNTAELLDRMRSHMQELAGFIVDDCLSGRIEVGQALLDLDAIQKRIDRIDSLQ
jgi:hypothetical protein